MLHEMSHGQQDEGSGFFDFLGRGVAAVGDFFGFDGEFGYDGVNGPDGMGRRLSLAGLGDTVGDAFGAIGDFLGFDGGFGYQGSAGRNLSLAGLGDAIESVFAQPAAAAAAPTTEPVLSGFDAYGSFSDAVYYEDGEQLFWETQNNGTNPGLTDVLERYGLLGERGRDLTRPSPGTRFPQDLRWESSDAPRNTIDITPNGGFRVSELIGIDVDRPLTLTISFPRASDYAGLDGESVEPGQRAFRPPRGERANQ